MTPAQILWLALGIYPRDVRELVPQTVQEQKVSTPDPAATTRACEGAE